MLKEVHSGHFRPLQGRLTSRDPSTDDNILVVIAWSTFLEEELDFGTKLT